MQAQVKRWGNSLGIRIPQSVTTELGLCEDSKVDLKIKGGQIVIQPKPKSYELTDLLSSITPENIHKPTDWGKPLGNEAW
jgi:antitoxin MazE